MYFAEPVMLIGEGEYNLNVLKEIKVTESFVGLDQEVTKCQSIESFENCTTRNYLDVIMAQCRCLPLNVRVSSEVILKINLFHIIRD